jgi:hypothetical protein
MRNKKPPKTTGQKSDTNNRVKIKVQRRLKMSRFQLYHMLVTDEQRHKIPKDIPNKYNFISTVVSQGKNKSSWNVKWDVLPVNNNVINNISRSKLTIVEDGEEEKPINDNEWLDEVEIISDTDGNNDNGCSPGKISDEDAFCSQDKTIIKDAATYTMKWGPHEEAYIDWHILPDSEYTSANEFLLDLPDAVDYYHSLGPDNIIALQDPSAFFFKYVFSGYSR